MRAVGYSEVTHIGGLTAVDPLGRSRTEPTEPFARVVVMILARPVSCQPVPLKPLATSPGISVYQLLSFEDENGCESSGFTHQEVSTI